MSEQLPENSTPEISHLDILTSVLKMTRSQDPEQRLEAIDYVSHQGAEISPEVTATLHIWAQLLDDDDSNVRDYACDALSRAELTRRIPEELESLLLDARYYKDRS